MENPPSYYFKLFNVLTDAITALDEKDYDLAKDLLVKAQQEAEEDFISEDE